MKRATAGLALGTLVAGTPVVLRWAVGPPGLPSLDGVSSTYVPVEAVLGVIGLLAWALWAYLVFAVLLNVSSRLAQALGLPGGRGLATATATLTPRTLRRLVEFAVGGAFVAASIAGPVRVDRHEPPRPDVTTLEGLAAASNVKSPKAEAPKRTYRVRPGDSLWRIAERELGSGFRWREIYRLNKGERFTDGRRLEHPRWIEPGWVLELPQKNGRPAGGKRDGPREAPVVDQATSAPEQNSQATEERSPAPSPSSDEPEPKGSVDGERDPEADEPEAEPDARPVLRLPSGLAVAASFGSGMLTAHLLGRLHRRRLRRPLMPEPDEPPEPPLAADIRRAGGEGMASRLDVALQAVTEAWSTARKTWPRVVAAVEEAERVSVTINDDEGPLPPQSGGSVRPLVRFSRDRGPVLAEVTGPFPSALRVPGTPMHRGALVPLGLTSDGAAVHCGLLAGGPIGIDGEVAGDLARQMIVATAAGGSPDDVKVTLLGTTSELAQLEEVPHVTGSHPWDRSTDFLREVQAEFVRRARLFLQEGVEDLSAHLAQHPDERFPLLLVVAGKPPNALRGLVEGLAREAPRLGAALIGVGWKPAAASLSAHADSESDLRTDLPGAGELRPLLLPMEAAQEAIEVIARAYPQERDREEEVPEEPAEPGEALILRPDVPTSIPDVVLAPADEPASGAGDAPGPKRDPAPEIRIARDAQADVRSDDSGDRSQPDVPVGVVAVRCLGSLSISRDGRPFRKGWRAKSLELVAFLVANPFGVPKDRIIEELWPEMDLQRGSDVFYVAASTIRAKLRVEDDQRSYVDWDGEIFRLQEGEWWVDVWEFERLATEAERGDDDETIHRLRDALALYRSDFCADNYYSWAEPTRERLRAAFVDASTRLADLLSTREAHQEALAVLDRAQQADPVCEDVCRRAMLAEADLGRRGAALARYRKLEAILDAELDVEPDPETEALARQLHQHGAPRPATG